MYRTVIHDGIVVTVDPDARVIDGGTVVVEGSQIAEVRPTVPSDRERDDADVIDADGTVVMPGLVNAHVHMEMSVLHALYSDLSAVDLMIEMAAMFSETDPELYAELAEAGWRLGVANSITNGITTFNTMDRDARNGVDIVGESGLRAVMGTMVSDEMLPASRDEQFERVTEFITEYHGSYDGRIRASLCAQGDMYCRRPTWERLADLAATNPELPVHTHLLETDHSTTLARAAGGDDSLDLMSQLGLLDERLLVAHFIAGDRADAERLNAAGGSVLHCPTVISYYSFGDVEWPPMKRLQRGGTVALGLDDPYWVDSWDLFREAKQSLCMERLLFGDDVATPHDALRMLTIEGARALGMSDVIGSLEPGKRADIIVLDMDQLKFTPVNHVPALLTNTATGDDVETVLVDGTTLLRNGELRTVEPEQIKRTAEAAVETFARQTDWDVDIDEATPPQASALARLPKKPSARWLARFGLQQLKDTFD